MLKPDDLEVLAVICGRGDAERIGEVVKPRRYLLKAGFGREGYTPLMLTVKSGSAAANC